MSHEYIFLCNDVFKCNDVNYLWDFYVNTLRELLDNMCPFKEFNIKKPKQDCVSQALLEKIAEKDRLLSRSYKTKDIIDKQLAIDARKQLNENVHTTREQHVNRITEDYKNDPAQFWKEISKLLPAKKSTKIELIDEAKNIVS